jgi:TRAP-type mannitol/chloroaromatic compound transport system permease small subunit
LTAVLLVLFTYFLQENEHVRLDHRFNMRRSFANL